MKKQNLILIIFTVLILFSMSACNLPLVIEENTPSAELEQTSANLSEEVESLSEDDDLVENETVEEISTEVESDDEESSSKYSESDSYTYESDILLDDEVSDLIYMREEEKLARDVYLTLYELWDLNIFKNIASSEQKHTDSVKTLLDAYDLPDIVSDDTVGVFANDELQKLYDELVEKGSQSLSEALLVGGLIEELDILDLQEAIEKTEREDILQVYNNLLNGSYNHLQAFVSNYERQADESYSPQLMSIEVFEEAYSARPSRGRGTSNQP